MKTYEVIWEIFNQCANNQIETDNPEEYVKNKFKDKVLKYDMIDQGNGNIVFDIVTSGIKQRMTFTEC